MNASSVGRTSEAKTVILGVDRARQMLNSAKSDLTPVVAAVLLVVPVVGAALFYVWTHVATVRLGYELSAAAKVHRALVEENRGLRIEVASLKSPERLERLAKTKYQLTSPNAGQIIYVPRGTKQ